MRPVHRIARALRSRLWLVFFCLSWLGCASESARGTATEVIVEIDADDAVKELMRSLRVRVEGGDGLAELAQRTTRFEESLSPVELPKRVALVPVKGAGDQRVFVVTATAFDSDRMFVAEARIIGGYVPGQVRYARLLIEGASCLRASCEDTRSTCSRGACVEATVDVEALSQDSRNPTTVGGPEPRTDRGLRDGGDDSGLDTSGPGEIDGSAFADTGTAPGDAQVDGDLDATPPVAAVFELGSACARPGQLACSDHDAVLTLICSGGTWSESLRCRSSERCDTRLGTNQGLCLDIVSECQDKLPQDAFCRGNQRMTCGPDRVTAEGVACGAGQVCVLNGKETACVADPDECAMRTDDCDDDPDACLNTFGGFMCQCPSGYTGDGQGANGCIDNDECSSGAIAACGMGATACTNTAGSYRCTCGPGYNGTGTKACADIDECAPGALAACGAGATSCSNTNGSFSCVCSPGYVGTGSKRCMLGAAIGSACLVASDCRRCSPSSVAVSCVAGTCVCDNGASCSANNQCTGTCAGGQCATADTSCDLSDDCRGQKICVSSGSGLGHCYLPEASACTDNAQCQGVCRPPDSEEGSVNRFCQTRAGQGLHCDENADCATNLVCRNTTGIGLHCDVPARLMEACDENADCMSSMTCVALAPGDAVCQ